MRFLSRQQGLKSAPQTAEKATPRHQREPLRASANGVVRERDQTMGRSSPGAPWQKGYAEWLNTKVGNERLQEEGLAYLPEARGAIGESSTSRSGRNLRRGPNGGGGFGEMCLRSDSAKIMWVRRHFCDD